MLTKDNTWIKEESNLTKEEWSEQQKWVQGFSHSKWLDTVYVDKDQQYVKVDGYGEGASLFIEKNEKDRIKIADEKNKKLGSQPAKWNYDVADSSE
jgi:hypothetical protein|tara:strand:- start:417 stop:704 length:288 start_codon:yes stop_codon:yes gene_type:complete